jgi:hypothetical protein
MMKQLKSVPPMFKSFSLEPSLPLTGLRFSQDKLRQVYNTAILDSATQLLVDAIVCDVLLCSQRAIDKCLHIIKKVHPTLALAYPGYNHHNKIEFYLPSESGVHCWPLSCELIVALIEDKTALHNAMPNAISQRDALHALLTKNDYVPSRASSNASTGLLEPFMSHLQTYRIRLLDNYATYRALMYFHFGDKAVYWMRENSQFKLAASYAKSEVLYNGLKQALGWNVVNDDLLENCHYIERSQFAVETICALSRNLKIGVNELLWRAKYDGLTKEELVVIRRRKPEYIHSLAKLDYIIDVLYDAIIELYITKRITTAQYDTSLAVYRTYSNFVLA